LVTSWTDLNQVRNGLTLWYKLTADLSDADGDYAALAGPAANGGLGWEPIGTSDPWAPFTGTFDGQGHTISDLYINRPETGARGLFGVSEGDISNVGMIDVDVTGGGSYTGGLVGHNYGTISNSYSTGSVSGNRWVGGLSGYAAIFFGVPLTVSNSYSTGSVSGSDTGGLVSGTYGGSITSSFWDTETSGQATSAGGTGKTTAEMKTLATFSGALWDIAKVEDWSNNIWFMGTPPTYSAGETYPRLWWEEFEWIDTTPPVLATGVNPATLTYDITASTVDIADVGTCTDADSGMHLTEPYQVSYSDAGTSFDANCSNNSYTITTAWGTSHSASFAGTDGHYYCIKLECKDAAGTPNTNAFYSASNILYDITAPTLTFTDNVAAGPVSSDTITATWGDASVKKWDYDADGVCSTTAGDYSKTDANSMTQSTETNNGKYICLYGEDVAGNKSTLASANDINIDVTAPIITIDNPDSIPSSSKTITASTNEGTLTMSNTSGLNCDETLNFIDYASQTFINGSDNNLRVCYKAVDQSNNISYSFSNPIAGIITSIPGGIVQGPKNESISQTNPVVANNIINHIGGILNQLRQSLLNILPSTQPSTIPPTDLQPDNLLPTETPENDSRLFQIYQGIISTLINLLKLFIFVR